MSRTSDGSGSRGVRDDSKVSVRGRAASVAVNGRHVDGAGALGGVRGGAVGGATGFLEILDVAGLEPPAGGDGRGRSQQAEEQDRVGLHGRREQQHHAHETAADGVAHAIEAHVDDALGGALLVDRHGHVEDLVARAE
jgi:hypothetical protein